MSPTLFARETSYCECETSFRSMMGVIQIWISIISGSASADDWNLRESRFESTRRNRLSRGVDLSLISALAGTARSGEN